MRLRGLATSVGWRWAAVGLTVAAGAWGQGGAQLLPGQGPGAPASAPATITLQDALARAQRIEPGYLGAESAALAARQDVVQARAGLLPSAGAVSAYFNTQGNGKFPSGRFVTNDGVHVYEEWATLHQDLSPGTLSRSGLTRARVAESLAQARAEVTRRGLASTVTRAYYGLVVAQRKYATAQLALAQAQQFVKISQDLETGGEAPHSDVVKAQIQYNTQDLTLRESQLAMDNARLDLAVLISADFDQNFQVVDDLHLAPALPSFSDVQGMARRGNPDLRAAMDAQRGAELDVTIARQAFLPTVAVDFVWGLQANQIGWDTVVAANPLLGPVPSVGYYLTATLNLPVWDWGARKSRLKQAELRRTQTQVELTATQRLLLRNLNGFYQEAQTSRDEANLLRQSADLAQENLRLNTLRYQAGEATILELVDAQNTLTQARNSYDDGLARYRVAVANLQTVTGGF